MSDNDGETMICFKCGTTEGTIIKHHLKYNPEIIVDCCRSCHRKIHIEIRKENSCPLSIKEIEKLSRYSSNRRNLKKERRNITFSETIMPNIRLVEQIGIRKSTNHINVNVYFLASNNKEIWNEMI